jgi:hypothetical protein
MQAAGQAGPRGKEEPERELRTEEDVFALFVVDKQLRLEVFPVYPSFNCFCDQQEGG